MTLKKKHINRIIGIILWASAGAGLLVLLVAAINAKNQTHCSGYNIEINGSANGVWFIDKADVVSMLTGNGADELKGRLMKSFNLKKLEQIIEKEVWILDAELFFDNNNVLQVEITERTPIARLFTNLGSSFYIDTSLTKLPLSDKMSAKLPVFTGFPSELTRRSKLDSALLNEIRTLSSFILANPFWMAQITQIDITPKREFEMIPMIGSHVIEFGKAEKHEEKFRRLMIFYKEVFAKSGMQKYATVKVQYEEQVVAVRNPQFASKYDSVQSVRAMEKLIASTYDEHPPIEGDSLTVLNTVPTISEVQSSNPIPAKPQPKVSTSSKVVVPAKSESKENLTSKRVPKAVMKKTL